MYPHEDGTAMVRRLPAPSAPHLVLIRVGVRTIKDKNDGLPHEASKTFSAHDMAFAHSFHLLSPPGDGACV